MTSERCHPRHGLRGALEDNLNGDDNYSCMSAVSNLRLRVTYVVPSS